MLTLETQLAIPSYVKFTMVAEDAFLLNTRTNKYFALKDVGTRLWSMLKDGKGLKQIHQSLLTEYEVEPAQLEKDILELVERLLENTLVEVVQE